MSHGFLRLLNFLLFIEYETMDLEMLREVVPMLRQQLEKSMLDRNYVQLERVSANEFLDYSIRKMRPDYLCFSSRMQFNNILKQQNERYGRWSWL